MSFVQKANNGTIFKNEIKEKETHPDYSGHANVNGVLYFVDAWIKEGAKGKYLSFRFKKMMKQEGAEQPIEEDIPF